MPAPEFRFGMTINATVDAKTHVFVDVFRSVLAHVGVKGEAGERLLDEVMAERRKGAAPGAECTVHFTAHAGEIEIALSQDGRSFRTTCPVPIR